MTAASDFIAAVHVKLQELGQEVPAAIGRKEWAKHTAPPCVKWALGEVSWGPPDTVGGQQQNIITRVQTMHLAIWCEDEDQAEELLDNVVRACRAVASGRPNFTPGKFEWITEDKPSWMSRGEALIGSISVRLQVTKLPTPNPLAHITSQQHTEETEAP